MKLESLQINLEPSYSDQAGQYTGKVTFENKAKGTIRLNLSPELSSRILEVIADELVATSRMVAQELTAQCIESVTAVLTQKKNPALTSSPD